MHVFSLHNSFWSRASIRYSFCCLRGIKNSTEPNLRFKFRRSNLKKNAQTHFYSYIYNHRQIDHNGAQLHYSVQNIQNQYTMAAFCENGKYATPRTHRTHLSAALHVTNSATVYIYETPLYAAMCLLMQTYDIQKFIMRKTLQKCGNCMEIGDEGKKN